jgi:glycosyltransferase involved in cell wall biosynthesis
MDFSICAAVIVKDEERCIGRCIDSLINKFDEYIFIDSGSVDRTIEIIKSKFYLHGVESKIIHKKWGGGFCDLRNEAIKNCSSDSLLFIDADEVLISSKDDLYKNFVSLSEMKSSVKKAICPVIINHDKNEFTTIPRGFYLRDNFFTLVLFMRN